MSCEGELHKSTNFLAFSLDTIKDHILAPEHIAENTVLLLIIPLFYLELLKLSVRSPVTCTYSFLSLDSLRCTLCQNCEEYLPHAMPHAAYLPYTSAGKS